MTLKRRKRHYPSTPKTKRPRLEPAGSKWPTLDDRVVKKLVDERDGTTCQACGAHCPVVFSRQHRIARGAGGSKRPEVNGPANRVRLCGSATTPGSCHLACETRDPDMARRGYVLTTHRDLNPAFAPLQLHTGRWVYLLDDGTRRDLTDTALNDYLTGQNR